MYEIKAGPALIKWVEEQHINVRVSSLAPITHMRIFQENPWLHPERIGKYCDMSEEQYQAILENHPDIKSEQMLISMMGE